MRALLIVNPRATSTTRLRRDVIASALSSTLKLEVVETRYRGHATKLAADARSEGFGLVLTLGGDGTVNEAVNGILTDHLSASDLPALAPLPGGSANVFSGALGQPRDPVDATGQILHALAERKERLVGLGMAEGRYFTLNAGLGLDAEVVRSVQGLRAHGRPVSPSLYVRLALRQFYRQTDRKQPSLEIGLGRDQCAGPAFLCIVSNTAPWTYLGSREVHAAPRAGFDTGLDILLFTKLSSATTLYTVGQMLMARSSDVHGRGVQSFHDQSYATVRSVRPIAFQIDGEYVGERESVTFRSVPAALRVVA